jgi:hypothetical protein
LYNTVTYECNIPCKLQCKIHTKGYITTQMECEEWGFILNKKLCEVSAVLIIRWVILVLTDVNWYIVAHKPSVV